jgi:serine/threonine-protein kinase
MDYYNVNNQSMLRVGTILRGIYRIESYLSSGGFGNTYVATNIEFNERYAIKEFFIKGVTHREENQASVSVSNSENASSFYQQKEKFKKEARRLRQLNNPHIVKVHDLFEENGTAYYVMDYVDGESLAERLKRTGQPMSEEEVIRILPQVLDALKSVHDAGLWHLDLKPGNIMLDKNDQVMLIDFGASKQMDWERGGATASTAISLTNGYAPREQIEKNYSKLGPWTDIYALGATLYALLTNNHPPIPSDIDDDASSDKHIALPFPNNVSHEMRSLVLQMMKTNRMQRPQTIQEVKDFKLEENPKEAVAPKPIPEPVKKHPETEETKVAEKKVDVTPKPQPAKPKVEVEQPKSETSVGSNKTWIWILLLFGLVVGLIVWVGNRYSSNNDSGHITAQEVVNPSDLQKEIIQGIIQNMVVADVGQCMYSIYINKYEVTRREWNVIMYDEDVSTEEMNIAMDGVSWEECQEFIQRLNLLYEKVDNHLSASIDHFRLPQSSEWVDAANGGADPAGVNNPNKCIYSGSNNLDEVAWYDNDIHEVGLKKPNSLGLYDMTGNVAEWCDDGPSDNIHYIQGGLPSFTNSFPNNADPIEGYNGESPTPDGKWHLGLRLSMYKGS